jgi:hypothetical protein
LRNASASEVSGFLLFTASKSASADVLAIFSSANSCFSPSSSAVALLNEVFVWAISACNAFSAA